MEIKTFIAELDKTSREYFYEPSYREDRIVLCKDETLLTVSIEFSGEKVAIYLYARTGSWDGDGDRSDMNDVFSTLPTLFLRLHNIKISCSLLDIEHPLGQGGDGAIRAVELYGRYIVFTQPYIDGLLPRTKESLGTINSILKAITEYECSLYFFIESNEREESKCVYEDANLDAWATVISKSLGENLDVRSTIYNWRVNPNWYYFRSANSKLSVLFAPKTAFMFQKLFEKSDAFEVFNADGYTFCKSGQTLNAFHDEIASKLRRVLFELEGDKSTSYLIPIENRLILISEQHIFFQEIECDRRTYSSGKEAVIFRRKKEQDFLFEGKTYQWSENIDGARFEEFTRELLARREGVVQVRNTSVTNEPDANADLICTWDTSSLTDMPQNKECGPVQRRRIVVQCKAWSKNIGKNDVPSIRDTLDRHDADGMLIVVSKSIARSLFEHMLALRRKGIWADYWDKAQIEDFLDETPDLVNKYPDIVSYAENV